MFIGGKYCFMSKVKGYKVHSIQYNFIMNVIMKASSILFPMITFPYVTRVLGAEAYGRVGFATSVVSYFAFLASLGIPSYAVRLCAKNREDEELLGKTVKEILTINLYTMVFAYTIFLVIISLVPKFREERVLLLICSTTIILQTFGVEWFYQSIEQYDYITFRNILVKVISIVALFLVVHNQNDYIPYAIVSVIGSVGSNILNILRLPKLVDIKRKYSIEIKKHIRPIIVLFFYYAATSIYAELDVLMLGFLTNNEIVGFYNASVKMKLLMVSIISSLGAVAMPRASYYLGKGEKDKFFQLIHSSMSFVLILSIPLAAFSSIEAKPIILLLAGKGFENASLSMSIITPSIIFIGMGTITAWQILIPMGREKETLYSAIIGAVVDFIVNLMLIPQYGAAGASTGTLLAEISVICTQLFFLRDIALKIIDVKNVLKILTGCAMSSFLMIGISPFLDGFRPFGICLINGTLFMVTYLSVELLLRENAIIAVVNMINSRIHKEK